MRHFDENLPVETIISGKLRRYNTISLLRQLTYPPIVLANIRDGFKVIAGFFQSLFKMIFWRPDVVFTKGGYVCLPIGLAARMLRIPLVIHDSDAHPGLTNRILARWASRIATGAPLKFYPYPAAKSRYVGIPISATFTPLSPEQQAEAKRSIGVRPDHPLVVITGGGLGARRINDAVQAALGELLKFTGVVLISGTAQYESLRRELPANNDEFQLHAFVSGNMHEVLGAADVVVARAGATTILELAALAKPTVLVPNAYLTGGHQLKNAQVYAEKDAVALLDEEELAADPLLFTETIKDLLADDEKRAKMSAAFHEFARPEAAAQVADMIMKVAVE